MKQITNNFIDNLLRFSEIPMEKTYFSFGDSFWVKNKVFLLHPFIQEHHFLQNSTGSWMLIQNLWVQMCVSHPMFRRPFFLLGVFIPLCLLQLSSAFFFRVPWSLRGKIWYEVIPLKDDCLKVSCSFHCVWLQVSVFIPKWFWQTLIW